MYVQLLSVYTYPCLPQDLFNSWHDGPFFIIIISSDQGDHVINHADRLLLCVLMMQLKWLTAGKGFFFFYILMRVKKFVSMFQRCVLDQ